MCISEKQKIVSIDGLIIMGWELAYETWEVIGNLGLYYGFIKFEGPRATSVPHL